MSRANKLERDCHVKEKDAPDKTNVFQPVPNFRVREFLRRILNFHLEAKTGQAGFEIVPHPYSEDFAVKFCNGNIRRFLRLMKFLVSSTVMQRAASSRNSIRERSFLIISFLAPYLRGRETISTPMTKTLMF